ncbi:MAG: tetratricopeptide repeat protein [Spirochaetes bacterium]|nr:tetratricopeptide repeat protein [Spirochaetota bacterium]
MKRNRSKPKMLLTAACALALSAAGALVTLNAETKNAIAYNKEGWNYLKKENYKKAVSSFKNALHDNPKYREALVGLGSAYLEVEAYEQSYDLFTAALAIDKQSVESLVGLGRTLTAMGRYTDAIRYFDRALRISGENLDARYGRAYVYNSLGKKIWAKRALETVLKSDPYHYDSLLLMADIKAGENRLREARRFAQKAIDTNSESSKAYTVYGELLLREFLNTEDEDLLDEAKDALSNAISIQPSAYRANRTMGNIALMEKKYDNAVEYFTRAAAGLDSAQLLYSLGVARDRAGNHAGALEDFLRALKKEPSDSILRGRIEDFLIVRDYKIGHPARVMLNREVYGLALNRERRNLPDQAMMYLRRSILLNPMNVEARERLMDYYKTLGYDRFYIDEMKEIARLNPDRGWQEKLSIAVMRRRDLLYHREGYSAGEPPRDVPVVLVLDFDPAGRISPHPDAGEVIAGHLTFALGQFGRMRPVGIKQRAAVQCGLVCGGAHLSEAMDSIESKIDSGELEPVDYVVYGGYAVSGGHITLEGKVLDYNKGFIIGEFSVTESGAESLPLLSLRAAKRVFDIVPYRGRVLKLKEGGIVANLGLFDGIGPGDRLVVYKFRNEPAAGNNLKKKIIFTVKESDTLISYAEPEKASDLESIDSSDPVMPLKKRRARRID